MSDLLKAIADHWPLGAGIVLGAFLAAVGLARLRKMMKHEATEAVVAHEKTAHAVDAVRWDGLGKQLETLAFSVHDVGQSVKAVHKRLDDHIDAPRRDRDEE